MIRTTLVQLFVNIEDDHSCMHPKYGIICGHVPSYWPKQNNGNELTLSVFFWLGMANVVNHGICQSVLEEAISAASSFFNQPMEQKVKFMSGDVHKPVRYGTGFNFKEGVERTQYWRLFLKHYAHPLQDWIGSWPENPLAYRYFSFDLMASYTRHFSVYGLTVDFAIGVGSLRFLSFESLNLISCHLTRQTVPSLDKLDIYSPISHFFHI